MFLSVIIPAYNEAERISPTLLDIHQYLLKNNYSYEILVVNNGSTDNTLNILNNLKENIKNLRIFDVKEKGKGGAVCFGVLKAMGDNILFMDADNSTRIKEIEKFIPFLNNFDVIIGSRYVSDSDIVLKQPLYKRIMGKGGRILINFFILKGIKDSHCGFKLFKKNTAKDIFKRNRMKGWSFDVEILAIARLLNYRIKEVGIEWKDDKNTHVKFSSYFRVLLDILKIKWNLINNIYTK